MTVNESFQAGGVGGFANRVSHVNGVKIGVRDEAIHGFEPDVVGVNVVGFLPAERFDSGIGFGAKTGRLGADEGVFTVGFVPDGNDFRALFGGEDAGAELGFALMGETVAQAKRKFSKW
jgi:hypothetical protein